VANQLALLGSVEVKVEPGLREKKITLELDVPLVEALEKVAAAAGAHLVRTGPKAFAIRSEPAAEGEAEEGERVPEWVRPLMKKLDETEVTFTWQGKPLGEILTWLSKESGVRIRLDPRVKSKRGEPIHIAEYDESLKPKPITASAARALDMALSYPTLNLARAWRFGGIWVSSLEHIQALPPEKAPPAADSKLARKINAARVTVKFTNTTLQKALEKVARKAKVKITLDRELRKALSKDRLDLDVRDEPLLEVLERILAPRGLVAELGEKGLAVRRAGS
jgi:hypothetical protein